jgi:hypothetical protein
VAKYDKVIPPGQVGTMEFNIAGDRVHGRFSKVVTVTTNDPKHQRMTITLSGHITPYVAVKPNTRVFLSGGFGETIEREITVTSNEKGLKEPFNITGLESNLDDKITYKVIPPAKGNLFKIKIWKNPNLIVGNHFGNLTINTNSENMPSKVVQIQVSTKSQMIVRPSILNFGTIHETKNEKDNHKQKSLVISNPKDGFEIEDITFSLDGYRAKVEPVKEGSSYKVTVDFFPQYGGRNFMGEMILHTNNPQEPKVRVRLIARLASR